jgi:hypothetical protein
LQVICYALIIHQKSIVQISVNEKTTDIENFLRGSVGDRPVHSLLNSSCDGSEYRGFESALKR